MVVIKAAEPNPDGLDEVFEAHAALKAVFEAGEYVEVEVSEGHSEVLLRLPGTNELVDMNDANALDGLERFIVQECGKELEVRE